MQFKKFFFSTLIGTVTSGILGIIMAINGMGAWALVAQTLTNTFIDTSILFFTVKWKPRLVFSKASAGPLFDFGIKILFSQLFGSIYDELRGLIIGKKYNADDLAYYNKGQQLPMLIVCNFDLSISSVLFASMSHEQEDKKKIKRMLSQTINITTFIVFPLMLGMLAVADNMIDFLLPQEWIQSVVYIRIICVAYLIYGTVASILQAIKAVGESGICLKIQIVHKIVMIPIIIFAVRYGVRAIAYTEIFSFFFQLLLVTRYSLRIIGYGFADVFRDCIKNFICSLIMALIVWWIGIFLNINVLLTLIIQLTMGIAIYIIMAIISRDQNLKLAKNLIFNQDGK